MGNWPWAASWAEIDWELTLTVLAAWVQALGALGALAVAITIDKNSARRLERDRAVQAGQLREDRLREARDIQNARIFGMQHAQAALGHSVREARIAAQSTPFETTELSKDAVRKLVAAETVLDYHLRQTVEVEHSVLAALVRAVDIFRDAKKFALNRSIWSNSRMAEQYAEQLLGLSEQLQQLLEDVYRERAFEEFHADSATG